MGLFDFIFGEKHPKKPGRYDPVEYKDYAKWLIEKGELSDAVPYLKAVIEHRNDGTGECYRMLCDVYMKLGRWQEASDTARDFDNNLGYLHEDWYKSVINEAQARLRGEDPSKEKPKRKSYVVKLDEPASTPESEPTTPKPNYKMVYSPFVGVDVPYVRMNHRPKENGIDHIKEANFRKYINKEQENYWDRLCAIKKKLPLYDFYRSIPEIPEVVEKEYKALIDETSDLLAEAATAEKSGDMVKAADCYEQLVAGRYWEPTPYENLIRIFKEVGLKEDAADLKRYAVTVFTKIRQNMKLYLNKCLWNIQQPERFDEIINEGETIVYYNGLFDVYNPCLWIEKWQ